jgi:hypothetical protein
MKTRDITVCSVASLALCGGLLLGTPGFAQDQTQDQTNQSTDKNWETGPQYSTPAEKAQTQQLNQQNGSGYVAPAQQAQYNQQQQQYQDQQQQYQDQKDQYREDRHAYIHNLHRYDEARYYFTDYPHPYPYRYADSHLRRLYLIAEPSQQLANVPIEGPDGQFVGRVRNVDIDVDGRPKDIQVALNHRVWVEVSPGNFRYDAENHVLYTEMTRSDLWNLPGQTYE